MNILGKKATFIPACMMDKNGNSGSLREYAKPVSGTVTMVHRKHDWFCVSFKAGGTVQRECFHFDEIGEAVTVHGYQADR